MKKERRKSVGAPKKVLIDKLRYRENNKISIKCIKSLIKLVWFVSLYKYNIHFFWNIYGWHFENLLKYLNLTNECRSESRFLVCDQIISILIKFLIDDHLWVSNS